MELLTPQLADFRRGQSESLVRAQSPPRNISEIRNSLKLDRAGFERPRDFVFEREIDRARKNETGFETGFETDSRFRPSGPGRAKCPKRCRFVSRFRGARVGQGPSETRNERTTTVFGFRIRFGSSLQHGVRY